MSKRSRPFKQAAGLQRPDVRAAETSSPGGGKRRASSAVKWLVASVVLIVVAEAAALVYFSLAKSSVSRKGMTDDPRYAEVEELIRRYFQTWSAQDMKGYGDCFLPNASIQFINAQGNIEQSALTEFIAYQGELLRHGEHETEAPESIEINFEGQLARVVVYWKLTAGARVAYGYDHYVLAKRDGKWGIVSLVWYETKHSG
jgi:hypothetical protein